MSTIITLQATDTAYIDLSQPTTNFGNMPYLLVGQLISGYVYRSLLKFDVSAIPRGSSIISANLTLSMNLDFSGTGVIASITPYAAAASWSGASVNWNNQPAINNSIAGPATNVTISGSYTWDAANLVNAWINGNTANNGLELKTAEAVLSETKLFAGRYAAIPSERPVMVIEYIAPSVILAGHQVDTGHEIVTADNTEQRTIARDTSQNTIVEFYVRNTGSADADVGVEVSADGIDYSQQYFITIPGGELLIFSPWYYAAFTRLYYKSTNVDQPTTLSINFLAQR